MAKPAPLMNSVSPRNTVRCSVLAAFCIASGIFLSSTCAAAEVPKPDPGWEEEKKADFNVTFDHDDKLDIGIGTVQGATIKPIRFTLPELAWFWKKQKHKEMIVVVLAKWDPTDDERKELAKRLTEYFFRAGFRRVLIRQASGGFGYHLVSDSLNPNEAAPAVPR